MAVGVRQHQYGFGRAPLPAPGETLTGHEFSPRRRQGATGGCRARWSRHRMVGRVGDVFGGAARRLRRHIDTVA